MWMASYFTNLNAESWKCRRLSGFSIKVSDFLEHFFFRSNRFFDMFKSNCLLEFYLLLVDVLTKLRKSSREKLHFCEDFCETAQNILPLDYFFEIFRGLVA